MSESEETADLRSRSSEVGKRKNIGIKGNKGEEWQEREKNILPFKVKIIYLEY